MESNVAESEDSKTLIPTEIDIHTEDRNGEAVDEARIEELRLQGIRPDDARRIERLERTLELPQEKDELDRVRAAAMLRADPSAREQVIARILMDTYNEKIPPYEALKRLQGLEIADEEHDFARFDLIYSDTIRLICYQGRKPKAVYSYRMDVGSASVKTKMLGCYIDDLPE